MPKNAMKYHTGLLMRDRLWDKNVHTVATKMFNMAMRGLVILVQKRVGTDCEYWALPVSK